MLFSRFLLCFLLLHFGLLLLLLDAFEEVDALRSTSLIAGSFKSLLLLFFFRRFRFDFLVLFSRSGDGDADEPDDDDADAEVVDLGVIIGDDLDGVNGSKSSGGSDIFCCLS